jgi:ribonuclease HI
VPGTKITTIGGVVYCGEIELFRYSEVGPQGTNADAEFASLMRCLQLASDHGINEILIKCDASILINSLRPKLDVVTGLIEKISSDPKIHPGAFKALRKITGKRIGNNLNAWQKWFQKNKSNIVGHSCGKKYMKYIVDIKKFEETICFNLHLIPRDQNIIADDLTKKARKYAEQVVLVPGG